MDSPDPAPVSPRAPANGLKLMLLIVASFALVAIYGQWQHFRRAKIESFTILSTPNLAPAPSPNESP